MRSLRVTLALALVMLAAPSSASAFLIQEFGAGFLGAPGNGIVLGPDGNFWVAAIDGNVVRLKPSGEFVSRHALGGVPTSVAVGPGDRVWVAVTRADKLTWFDAKAATPTAHDVSTFGESTCGPVGIVSGGDGRMYFSLPNDGSADCPGLPASRVGSTLADGSGGTVSTDGLGTAFDLEVSGGKLFIPDFGGNVIRRTPLGTTLTADSTVTVTGGNPDGIAADGSGNLWVTLYNAGKVARFAASQVNGNATEIGPSGGTLTNPFGIVLGPDGRMYVTGQESANLARILPDTSSFSFYTTPGGKPWQIVAGPDEDLWFTDIANARVLRFVNAKPRASTGEPRVLAPTVAGIDSAVDPRGNPTVVTFDYGTTTAYGQTAGPFNVPNGATAVNVAATVTGLTPGTTYHVRVRAANGEGETVGADKTFTTQAGPVDADRDGVSPPTDCDDTNPAVKPGASEIPGNKIDEDCSGADAPFPLLAAEASFSWRFGPRFTLLVKLRLKSLRGDETVTIACRGRGCPFKRKIVRPRKRGAHKLDKLFGRKRRLRPGTRVEIRITAPNAIGRIATLTVRSGRDPRIVRRCLRPGVARAVAC